MGSSSRWKRAGLRVTLVLVALAALVAGVLLLQGDTHGAAQSAQTVVFDDEFDGPRIDASSWLVLNRGPDTSNSEQQCYLPSNVSQKDGSALIVLRRDDTGCTALSDSHYSSGMLQWRSFNFTYGRVDVRAKMSGGQGAWPAIWLLGYKCQRSNPIDANDPSCDWPKPGADEIDIAEILNSSYAQINQQIHTASSDKGCTPSTDDSSQSWHVYSLDWQPGSLTFYIDGKQTCKITDHVPSTSMFLILNTAAGGVGGSVDDSSLPVTQMIDYVRVTRTGS